jgi:phosphate transport system substrate-binding protein
MQRNWGAVLLTVGCMAMAGCGSSGGGIHMLGSDTMLNVAGAWAEDYNAKNPTAAVQVSGGGSGVGIASLIDGTCDMANASRKMEPKEIERLKENRKLDAKEFIVGYDALAVYVHKDNPLDSISIDELAEIYGDGGKTNKWSQLGVDDKKLGTDKITRVSRQNSSGTYAYFRETVLGKKRDYKQDSIDVNGSVEVVSLIEKTPGAIGYSGMGYATPGVKMLKISRHKGEKGVAPTVENARKTDGGYPITRPLLIYTAGEPQGEVKKFLDWILGREGQQVVIKTGYVPVGDSK